MGKRKKEELPDYTVANMDVDGMPWNSRRPWQIFPGDPSKSRKEFDVKVPEPGMENEVPDDLSAFQNPPMTKEERRGIIWLSLKASLTVGLIFGSAAFLFILFCVFFPICHPSHQAHLYIEKCTPCFLPIASAALNATFLFG